jgi:hypothetical protein
LSQPRKTGGENSHAIAEPQWKEELLSHTSTELYPETALLFTGSE